MGSSKFSLNWSDHESSLVGSLRTLLQNNSLVDCTLAAEGQYVKVHRLVLSATSPYFQKLFDQDSDKHPIVFLKDVKFHLLMSMLDFIYSGKVQILEDQLEEFLATAQSLEIKGLSSNNKYDGIDVSQSSPKASNSDDANAFQDENEFLPEGDEDNLVSNNSNSNASPSLDHQYCADSGDAASPPPLLIVSAVSNDQDANSSTCEVLDDSDSKVKTSLPELSGAPSIVKSPVNVKPIVKWNDSSRVFLKLKRQSMSETVNKVCAERIKRIPVAKSALKAVFASPQLNKISHKSGTIVITKPVGIYSTVPTLKQKVVSPSQKRQAFVVGSKVLAVPHSALLSGTKDWLQPPKPHTEGKLHPCPECNKTFRKPSILANHLRTHTGEKPYQCQECGRMFNQSSNFRRHQRTHVEHRAQAIMR